MEVAQVGQKVQLNKPKAETSVTDPTYFLKNDAETGTVKQVVAPHSSLGYYWIQPDGNEHDSRKWMIKECIILG